MYHVGQGIVVICPFDPANEKAEIRARIVRTEAGSDRERYLYAPAMNPHPTSRHPWAGGVEKWVRSKVIRQG